MKMIRKSILCLGLSVIGALMSNSAVPQELSQITACVEPTLEVANNVSRKRASTRTDCDPATARARSRQQAGVHARDAIAPICVDRVTATEAEATCTSHGLSVPTTTTSLGRAPIAADGRPAANASLPIQGNAPKLCAILRNVPNETQTTTQENLFCFFNEFKSTTVTSRVRATCGVQCF